MSGFSARSVAWSRPECARPPTLKFSTTMSACCAICRISAWPSALARSMVTERLLRLQAVKELACAVSLPAASRRKGGPQWRVSSPAPGRPTLTTSPPRSASICVHQGPASTRERSSTLMPASAALVGALVGAVVLRAEVVMGAVDDGVDGNRWPWAPGQAMRQGAKGSPRRSSPGRVDALSSPSVRKGGDAGDGASQDQRMHVMRAFVGVDHFQVHQVARQAEFVADAVASHHVARQAGDVQRLAATVALDDGGGLDGGRALVLHAAQAQTGLRADGDLGLHVGQLFLDQLVRRQRPAKLFAFERVLACAVPAELRRPPRAPRAFPRG